MKNHLLLTIAISVTACTVNTTEQEACLYECYNWNDVCGYDEEESTDFCEQQCVNEITSHPKTCEECFECVQANQWTPVRDYCYDEPGLAFNSAEPCFNVCWDCSSF